VRDFLTHIPKERRQFDTCATVERRLNTAGGSVDDLSIALQMALQLERVEYR
jgi:hypothetical protein